MVVKAWLGGSKVAFDSPYFNFHIVFAILTIIKP
jgi:hypothetical protein